MPNMRATSMTWNFRDSRNCASVFGMEIGWNFAPDPRTTMSCARAMPAVFARHRRGELLGLAPR
jgi:hypothetical protein